MSTAPVIVAISAQDLTGPGFASATAKGQLFQSSMNNTAYSMREARGAAMLLGEEIGVKLNRHLTGFLANIPQIGGLMASAFSVVAVVGFIEYAARIPEAINKMTDALAGFDEASKKAMTDATSANDAAFTQFKTLAEGYKLMDEMRKRSASSGTTQDKFSNPFEGVATATATGGLSAGLTQLVSQYSFYNSLKKENEHWGTLIVEGMKQETKLGDELVKKADELAKKNEAAAERALRNAQEVRNAWLGSIDAASKSSTTLLDKGQSPADKELTSLNEQLTVWEKIKLQHAGINVIANDYIQKLQHQVDLTKAQAAAAIQNSLAQSHQTLGDAVTGGGGMPVYTGTKQAMDILKIQTDQNFAMQEAGKIYDSTRTKAQAYSDEMEKLVAVYMTGKISEEDFSREAMKLGAGLNENAKHVAEFGKQVGQNIEQAMLFGRSWSNVLKAVLADIIKLILQMYVFKSLSTAFGGAGGGFAGQLFAGMAGGGKAGGGSVAGGMSYLVGEKGPELFTPGSSGNITPNGRFGGQTTYNIDARGADASVEQRIMRLLPLVEERAKNRAVAEVQERNLRR